MVTTLDEAVSLGLSVQAALTSQDLNPDRVDTVDGEIRRAALERSLQFLQAVGLVSETDLASLTGFLDAGDRPASSAGDRRTVGSALITVAQRYPYYGSTVVDVTAALTAVADAAVDGMQRAGASASAALAAIAAVQVLGEKREEVAPTDHAHKE